VKLSFGSFGVALHHGTESVVEPSGEREREREREREKSEYRHRDI
jgi:hypothetical protein